MKAQQAVDFTLRHPLWLPKGLSLQKIDVVPPPAVEANAKHLSQVILWYGSTTTHEFLQITETALTVTQSEPTKSGSVDGVPFAYSEITRGGARSIFFDFRSRGVTYEMIGTGISLDALKHIATTITH